MPPPRAAVEDGPHRVVKCDLAEAMAEQAVVERALTKLFCATVCDDVGIRELLRELGRRRVDMDMNAVEAALAAPWGKRTRSCIPRVAHPSHLRHPGPTAPTS